MLTVVLEGLAYGLVLSVLTGPIFFSILQVSIERGRTAGIALVAGQWLSDIIYIVLAFQGAAWIQKVQEDQGFRVELATYLGTAGSIFLLILGLILLLSKPKDAGAIHLKNKSLWGYFTQGFLINTLTPFPIFFWVSLMSSAMGRNMSNNNSLLLCFSVLAMVVITDWLKVYAARFIQGYLSQKTILGVRRAAGLGLALFGLGIFIRIFFFSDSL